MKKTYYKPESTVFEITGRMELLAGSTMSLSTDSGDIITDSSDQLAPEFEI